VARRLRGRAPRSWPTMSNPWLMLIGRENARSFSRRLPLWARAPNSFAGRRRWTTALWADARGQDPPAPMDPRARKKRPLASHRAPSYSPASDARYVMIEGERGLLASRP